MAEYPHILYVVGPGTENELLFVPAETTPPDPPDPPDPEEPPPDPDANAAFARITCGDLEVCFDPAAGEELDCYYDPLGEFVQRNIRCTDESQPNMVAWYRPDVAGGREEWVFELGPAFASPQANMPAYTAVITRADGGTGVSVEAKAGHYWFGRWRWQSAPRPVRRTYEALAAQHLIPHLDCRNLATGPILSVSAYTPMSTCGMPQNQGQTGGYPGLGILTGWLAQYLARNAPEDAWRAQADAMASYPTHQRDPDTHTPLDIVSVWPGANMYSSSEGSPYIPKGPSPCRTDHGHLPSVCYIPFLLTGDPYFLEEMQFTCNYQQLSLPSDSRCMIMGRYLAWPLRAIAECVAATPDVVPSWLLPRSYWVHWLDTFRGHVEARASNSSDPYCYVFHTILESGQTTDLDPSKSGDHVWQQAMLDLVTSWIACWRDEWVEPAEWCIHSCIARASPTSGWVRSRPSPYHIRLQNASVLSVAMTKTDIALTLQYPQLGFQPGTEVTIDKEVLTLEDSSDLLTWTVAPRVGAADHAVKRAVYGAKCLSWQESADLNVATYGWTGTEDNTCMLPTTEDLTYPSYQRAALAQAITAQLEVPELHASFRWLDEEIRGFVAAGKLKVGDNWAVVPMSARHGRRHRRHRSERIRLLPIDYEAETD